MTSVPFTYEGLLNDLHAAYFDARRHKRHPQTRKHIRQESLDYSRPCYVLKMDIKGYFMHIDRHLLLDLVLSSINRTQQKGDSGLSSGHCDFLRYLTREIVLLDPLEGCHIKGSLSDWEGLSRSKSLFWNPPDCGLPIGNLTSQMFSNVYLNVLDQYMKRDLHCRHYGRYVDDFYVVSSDREWLLVLVPKVSKFLQDNLGLTLQCGKTCIYDVRYGVPFLGAYLKPRRSYVSAFSLRRMDRKMSLLESTLPDPDAMHLRSSLSSMMGLMRQHSSYNLRFHLTQTRLRPFLDYGHFDAELTKFIPDAE